MAAPINTKTMPGDNMHPDAIESAARGIRGVGSKVSKKGATVQKTWTGLAANYHAPEQNNLLHAMNPAKKSAEDFGDDMDKVASALETFAGEVRTIKAAVKKIRADAKTFLGTIHDGKVSVTEHRVANYAEYERGESETTHKDVDWNSDQDTVDANNALIRRTNDQQEALWAAERKCANTIQDLYGGKHFMPKTKSNPKGYGMTDIPDGAKGLPWGQTVSRKESCGDKVVNGVFVDGLGGMGRGLTGLFGVSWHGWKPDWSISTAGKSWNGLGQLANGLVNPATPLLAMLPGPAGRWFNSSEEASVSFVPGLVGIDPFKHDPNKKWYQDWNSGAFDKWKDDPIRTASSSVFNVGTFFIPGAGEAGAGAKGVARGAETVGDTSKALKATEGLSDGARAVDLTGDISKSIKGATKTELGNLGKTTEFDNSLKGLGDDLGDIDVPHGGMDTHHTNHSTDAPPAREPEHTTEPSGGSAHEHQGTTPDGTKPTHSGEGKPYDPNTPAHDTVPAKDAPHHYTQHDVQKALDDAPVNEHGQPVDPRTGEPLKLERSDGTRGWEMRWDADHHEWVAQNHGSGYAHGMPDHGTPGSFGYDEHGKLMPYANHRPSYADGQVEKVWNRADTDGDGVVTVYDKHGEEVEIRWDGTSNRDGVWDMGHMPGSEYAKLRHEYLNHEITHKEFMDRYHDPDNYEVQEPGRNRSHVDEMP